MKAAIYARKSKATDKGESIENQISRGEALCKLRGWDYEVFQDYDYSGKSLDRPDFERLMRKVRHGEIQCLICYKLDRISRSVNDFSSLVEELNSLGVGFICIKDNFDTTNPMGRAMMYITAVFAQLERETIAERVQDNMIDRAKNGKWNGGPVPLGFSACRETLTHDGRNKKVSKLVINPEEAEIIKQFYNWYLELDGSVRNNVIRANSHEYSYKTKNDVPWNQNQMSRILQNPIYCIADKDAYDFFKSQTKVQIVNSKEEFDGTLGLMYYNRRKPHKNTTRERNEEEWILVIGEHEGFIPGALFKKVQDKLFINKNRAPREGQSAKSPLAGLVKCDRCGSAMSVFSSKKSDEGYYGYFKCITREQKSKVLCDNLSVRADILEKTIVDYIGDLCKDKNAIQRQLEATNDELSDKLVPLVANRNKIQSEIDSIEVEIKNLVIALGKDILPEHEIKSLYKEFKDKKGRLQEQLDQINYELDANYTETYNIEYVMQYLDSFNETYQYLSFEEKRKLLQSLIKEIRVSRENIKLTLYFLPSGELNHAFCSRMGKDS